MKLRYCFVFAFTCLLLMSSANAERIYLSGKDASDAIPWDFKISTGRNSGFWTTIPVPSNWEQQGFGFYTYGNDHENFKSDPEIGFYKRTFSLNEIENKRYRLVFQGSMTDTHVKINGDEVGVHRGGFMQFSYEITDYIKEGQNQIEVEVHKSSEDENVQEAERISDFWLFGGIFRPVYIDVLPEEFIDRVAIDAQMDGSFEMDIYLGESGKNRIVRAVVKDENGIQIGNEITSKVTSETSVIRLSNKFEDVNQWSHEFPNLYYVEVYLLKGKKVVHKYQQKFGFRTFEVRDHDGFYLNGKRILLKGAALHSFRPKTGRTLSKADIEENFKIMKDLNFTAIRPCHYPPDEYLLELCDSLGLLVIDELTGWHHSLNKANGSVLVKELVARNVNHPSVVLWSNGNHYAHNPELDEDFFKWDIQKRRPLKNAAKSETWPGGYKPDFDVVDTRYYPSYKQLIERLNDNHIYLPNESLHALYDGGGAAGLYDYWKAIKASKVGGGMMIWALMDEGLYNTDLSQIDVQVNKAYDGLVGPNGENEGSYFAVKEIWSPVQIAMKELPENFQGEIEVESDFLFVDLNQCRFNWQLINFTKPNEAEAGFRSVISGNAKVESVPAGEKGKIKVDLPNDWKNFDAIRLEAYDHYNQNLFTWVWKVKSRKELVEKLAFPLSNKIEQDADNKFQFTIGQNTLSFDPETGVLLEIKSDEAIVPVSNAPFLVSKSVEEIAGTPKKSGKVILSENERGFVIESYDNVGFDWFKWEISNNGTLKLSYKYALPTGKYYYAGVGLEVETEQVLGKRWLGEGPYRVWKNRTQGGLLNVWDSEKESNIPGKVWNVPEFEGCFSPWYWAVFRFRNHGKVVLSTLENNLTLGVLNPVNGEDPKFAIWRYPEKEGIYLFNCISPVGGKWKDAFEYGPGSQATEINTPQKGSFQIHLPQHLNGSIKKSSVKEIE